MNTIRKKISAFLLSCIVLFSSMSFTIDEHLCGNIVIDVSYFGNANDCGSDKFSNTSNITEVKRSNCCTDEIIHFESSLFNIENLVKPPNLEHQVLFFNACSYVSLLRVNSFKIQYYPDFPPPDISKDFQVLHQTFLI